MSLCSRKAYDKLIAMTWKKRWVAHARWWAITIFQLSELNIKSNRHVFQCTCANYVANWLGNDSAEHCSFAARDHDLREHIPVPYDNLFQSILSSRHAVKVIFSLGRMVTQAMANGHQVVSI